MPTALMRPALLFVGDQISRIKYVHIDNFGKAIKRFLATTSTTYVKGNSLLRIPPGMFTIYIDKRFLYLANIGRSDNSHTMLQTEGYHRYSQHMPSYFYATIITPMKMESERYRPRKRNAKSKRTAHRLLRVKPQEWLEPIFSLEYNR